MGDVVYIWWRGRRFSPDMAAAIEAAEQRSVSRGGGTFTITQGGFNSGGVAASAGTHDGDAVDMSVSGLTKSAVATQIEALRWAGIAAWLRTSTAMWGVRSQGFGAPHIHGVPNGWGYPSYGAKRQAIAYRNGRDGLVRNLADIGPGHVKGYYLKTRPETPDTRTDLERLLDTMDTNDLKNIIREVHGEQLMADRRRSDAEIGADRALWKAPTKGRTDEWGASLKDSVARTAHRSGATNSTVLGLSNRVVKLESKLDQILALLQRDDKPVEG